jgi:hypothetical protein
MLTNSIWPESCKSHLAKSSGHLAKIRLPFGQIISRDKMTKVNWLMSHLAKHHISKPIWPKVAVPTANWTFGQIKNKTFGPKLLISPIISQNAN